MRTNLAVSDLGDLLEQPLLAVLATFRAPGHIRAWDFADEYAD